MNIDKKLLERDSTEAALIKKEFKEIPYKKSQSEFQEYGPNVATGMIVFLVLAWLALFVIKKFIKKMPISVSNKKLVILERTKTSSRSSLLLVKFQSKHFILSQSGDNITLISEIDNPSDE